MPVTSMRETGRTDGTERNAGSKPKPTVDEPDAEDDGDTFRPNLSSASGWTGVGTGQKAEETWAISALCTLPEVPTHEDAIHVLNLTNRLCRCEFKLDPRIAFPFGNAPSAAGLQELNTALDAYESVLMQLQTDPVFSALPHNAFGVGSRSSVILKELNAPIDTTYANDHDTRVGEQSLFSIFTAQGAVEDHPSGKAEGLRSLLSITGKLIKKCGSDIAARFYSQLKHEFCRAYFTAHHTLPPFPENPRSHHNYISSVMTRSPLTGTAIEALQPVIKAYEELGDKGCALLSLIPEQGDSPKDFSLLVCTKLQCLLKEPSRSLSVGAIRDALLAVSPKDRLALLAEMQRSPRMMDLFELVRSDKGAVAAWADLMLNTTTDFSLGGTNAVSTLLDIGNDRKQKMTVCYLLSQGMSLLEGESRETILVIAKKNREAHRVLAAYQAALTAGETNKCRLLLQIGLEGIIGGRLNPVLKQVQTHDDKDFDWVPIEADRRVEGAIATFERWAKRSGKSAGLQALATESQTSGKGSKWFDELASIATKGQLGVALTQLTLAYSKLPVELRGLLRETWRDSHEALPTFVEQVIAFTESPVFLTILRSPNLFERYRTALPDKADDMNRLILSSEIAKAGNMYAALMRELDPRPADILLDQLATVTYLGTEPKGFLDKFDRIIIWGGNFGTSAELELQAAFPGKEVLCFPNESRKPRKMTFGGGDLVVCQSVGIPHDDYLHVKREASKAGATFRHSHLAGVSGLTALVRSWGSEPDR